MLVSGWVYIYILCINKYIHVYLYVYIYTYIHHIFTKNIDLVHFRLGAKCGSYPPPKKQPSLPRRWNLPEPACKTPWRRDSIGGEGGWLPGLQKPTSWIPYKFPRNGWVSWRFLLGFLLSLHFWWFPGGNSNRFPAAFPGGGLFSSCKHRLLVSGRLCVLPPKT